MTKRFRSTATASIITDLAVVELVEDGLAEDELAEDGLVLRRLDRRVDEKSGPRRHRRGLPHRPGGAPMSRTPSRAHSPLSADGTPHLRIAEHR